MYSDCISVLLERGIEMLRSHVTLRLIGGSRVGIDDENVFTDRV